MSSQWVSSIFQDRTGYLWFVTLNGLDKYDGYSFTNYKYPFNSKVINTLVPRTIGEDKEGNLWVVSGNGGIEKFDPHEETFRNYILDPKLDATDWGNTVLAVHFDRNDVMWVGTGQGLYKFNKEYETFTAFRHDEKDPFSLGHNNVNGIIEDKSGTLWIATGGGLDKLERGTNKFFHYWYYPENKWHDPNTMDHWLLAIVEDEDGILWIGTDAGLLKFDKKEEKFSFYRRNVIISLCEDTYGKIWLGTIEGLDVFNRQTETFTNYGHEDSNPLSLSSNYVFDVMIDRAGSLWITTQTGGVNKLDYPGSLFISYKSKSPDGTGFSLDEIVGLYDDDYGKIQIGTSTGMGILKFKNGRILKQNDIRLIWLDHDLQGNTIVAPVSGGLYKLNKNNSWTCYIDSVNATPSESIQARYLLNDGDFWIGCLSGELYSFSPKTKERKLIDNIKSSNFWSIYQDSDGLVWFGGWSTGIFCFDSGNDSITEYVNDPNDSSTIIDNTYVSYCEDKNRTLWLGFYSGLVRYNRSEKNFTRFYAESGFFSNGIRKILEDRSGKLWMSSVKGIAKFDPVTSKFNYYYAGNYFPEIELSIGVGCKTKNGEMYFGGKNGFIRFYPDSIKEDTFIPPIVITTFKKFEKPFHFDKEIELSHSDNFISFEFAALSYINGAENQYAYKMEGIDKDWVYCGTRRYASYPNMLPGEYVFRVKGSSGNRVWNEAGTSIKVIIFPPWWETWWAYILYTLIMIAIFTASTRFYLNRQRLKQKLILESEHAEKLEEIAKLKSDFFANISHEFRTPLTLILGPVRQIIERTNENKTRDDLKVVHKNANRLLNLVNQLLDISKIESGNMKLLASQKNIVPLLKALLQSFISYAERKRITLKFSSSEDEIIAYIDQDKLEKIITNILSNAFKFTPEGGRIEVRVKTDEKYFNVSISDTGVGIPETQKSKIFDRFYQVDGSRTREHEGTGIGLSLTKELVELHKGKIELKSKEGEGTTFTISIPLGNEYLKSDEIVTEITDKEKEPEKDVIELSPEEFTDEVAGQKYESNRIEKLELPILMIVEDNSDVRNYIKNNLEKEYRILEAADGEDGWNRSINEIPDLIISDVMMPKMDGFKLCDKLKTDERTSHIPVILLTAKAALQDKIEGFETGADDYIMKPFEPDELRARIKNLIEQRRRIHEHFKMHGLFELEEKKITPVDQRILKKIFETINQNISDSSLSVEFLVEHLSLSRSVLHRKVVSLLGETPGDLIRRIRLTKAADLIKQGFGNLSETALEVGFSNPAHFSESFKKQFGVTPSQYQQKSSNK